MLGHEMRDGAEQSIWRWACFTSR